MGCFSVQHERKIKRSSSPSSSLAHTSLRNLLELKHGTLPSSSSSSGNSNNSSSKIHTHDLQQFGSSPSFRARAALHSASSKLVKNRPRALPRASSSLSNAPNYHREDGGGDKICNHGYGYGEERFIISHSAPIPSLAIDSEEVTSHGHLFPLPLPPAAAATAAASAATDDASSQSVSSTGSGSSSSSSVPFSSSSVSTRSGNFKGYNNPLNSHSTLENNTLQTMPPLPLQALPLPPPPDSGAILREFSFDELAGACLNFAPEFFIRDGGAGPVFRAIVKYASEEEGTFEVAVTRLIRAHSQSFKRWRAEVGSLGRLSHPHLCKVLGFSGEDPSRPPDMVARLQRERLLVYEHTSNGSLESLLYCRKGKAPLDWATRLRIAMGAAQGLAFLHDRIPRQIIYKSFKTINVQVDQNFNAKLSDYGFARSFKELPSSSPAHLLPVDDAYAAPETRISDELSTKSNVWSFGIVLLELLTGRQNMDDLFPAEERNLLQWCRPYLLDSKRLYLVMDPELKGRYLTRDAKMVADLALQCLSEDPVVRPSMRDVAVVISSLANECNVADIMKVDHVHIMGNNRGNGSKYSSNSCKFINNHSNGSTTNNSTSSKFRISRSYNLASVLASPARSFTCSQEHQSHGHQSKTRFRGFLSEEITKEASRSLAGSARDHPFLSRYGFLSGEIGLQAGSPSSPPSRRTTCPLPSAAPSPLPPQLRGNRPPITGEVAVVVAGPSPSS